jgi:hypothetical protein
MHATELLVLIDLEVPKDKWRFRGIVEARTLKLQQVASVRDFFLHIEYKKLQCDKTSSF